MYLNPFHYDPESRKAVGQLRSGHLYAEFAVRNPDGGLDLVSNYVTAEIAEVTSEDAKLLEEMRDTRFFTRVDDIPGRYLVPEEVRLKLRKPDREGNLSEPVLVVGPAEIRELQPPA